MMLIHISLKMFQLSLLVITVIKLGLKTVIWSIVFLADEHSFHTAFHTSLEVNMMFNLDTLLPESPLVQHLLLLFASSIPVVWGALSRTSVQLFDLVLLLFDRPVLSVITLCRFVCILISLLELVHWWYSYPICGYSLDNLDIQTPISNLPIWLSNMQL